MPEFVAAAPLLQVYLLGNRNNNNAAVGTVVVQEQVVEIEWLRDDAEPCLEAGVLHLRAENSDPKVLTHDQCEFYDKNGYLVLPDALRGDDAALLLKEAHDVMQRIFKGGEGIIKHDASGNQKNIPSPIGRILATFESEHVATSNSFDRPIARLGCGIHQQLPSFRTMTHSELHRSIAESLGYEKPYITQSQIITKLAGVGGRIIPHQDGCVSFTNPPSCLTFWYALEDATLENGCLRVAAGSHLTEPLRQRLVTGSNGQPTFKDLNGPLWARGADGSQVDAGHTMYNYKPLEVKQGTLVIFHGNLMHTSEMNKSGRDRLAYTFSIVENGLECPEDTYMKPLTSL